MHTERNVMKVCIVTDCSATSWALHARWSPAAVCQHRRDRSCIRLMLTVSPTLQTRFLDVMMCALSGVHSYFLLIFLMGFLVIVAALGSGEMSQALLSVVTFIMISCKRSSRVWRMRTSNCVRRSVYASCMAKLSLPLRYSGLSAWNIHDGAKFRCSH